VLEIKEIKKKLKKQHIETPSWGYADSGTRFKVFKQPGVAKTVKQKLEDAAQVQKFTGISSTVAIHIPWDNVDNWDEILEYADNLKVKIGAVNPNLFQDDEYKLGSICNPYKSVRKKAVDHIKACIDIAKKVDSNIISLWLADGTNYPGQDSFKGRKHRLEEALRDVYNYMPDYMRLLIEYKFFEPAFYHTDIHDWGIAYLLSKKLGEKAQVLVDLGHHPPGYNIEQVVAILIDERKMGGFHFNNKKYADDDLTVGSINPYELFLIYNELVDAELNSETTEFASKIAYMIDQSHNVKNKIEAMIQSVVTLQEIYAKALFVDRDFLKQAQLEGRIIDAEECLKDAFFKDVKPLLKEVRKEIGLDPDPLLAFRKSGYLETIAHKRV